MRREHGNRGRRWLPMHIILACFLVIAAAVLRLPAPAAAETTSTIAGPVGALAVDDGRTAGVPVVFLHSYAGNAAHWSNQLTHLRNSRRAVAIDLRGHGRSATPASLDTFATTAMAEDVKTVADQLKLDRFVLVGHSMGGAVAIAYAGMYPERVAGLVLVATPGKVPGPEAEKIVASLEADYDKVMAVYWNQLLNGAQPQVRERIGGEMGSVPKPQSLAIIKATFAFDPAQALTAYRGPKLAITADGDNQPHALHKAVSGLPHEAIPGTSHWPHLDKPEEFNRILDEFLKLFEE
jgi:pimeloyl-ACP methyl ester carboxylesterase